MSDNRYSKIIERIFFAHFKRGTRQFSFRREEIESTAAELCVKLPKNIGDVVYTFRFRQPLPERIVQSAPEGMSWVIKLAGDAVYCFELSAHAHITPNKALLRIKIPDATPGIISRYAMGDEQALLALVRYNRLIDIFTGVASYSLQSHLRTKVKGIGQIEIDELYVGIDRRGAHYVFPVQAKGGRDKMSVVQIEQDAEFCAAQFGSLICRPIGAQFLEDGGIAMMEFAKTTDGCRLAAERHYQLVPKDSLSEDDLHSYKNLSREE